MNAADPGQGRARTFSFERAWTQQLGAPGRGLAMARERGWLLAWDANHWLYLFDDAGQKQGQTRHSGSLVAAAFADDGSAIVTLGKQGDKQGEITWLAPDLMPRWQQSLPHVPLAVAVDAFAQYAAFADRSGNLTIVNRLGKTLSTTQTPRPLHHLAFVLSAPVLLGCADLGLVLCLELDGNVRWRDGLFANVGALTASADGLRILVACFSEGLQEYDLAGTKKDRITAPEPCRCAALACTGQFILVAGLTSHRLMLLDAHGHTLASEPMNQELAALTLHPLGDGAAVVLADGTIRQYKIARR
ncbi:MAG: hypothetical protein FJ271_26235 [Planctomycetes bacterium]|nr:hypothetical protein [Planctomycetota bacterium]